MKKLRERLLNREVISYLIFGILTTLVNWMVYHFALNAGSDYRTATAIAWLLSVLFAFLVNKIFVFQSRRRNLPAVLREFLSFVLCRTASGVMEMAFMIVLVSWLHVDEYGSKILVSVFVVIANYGFSKRFIFRKKINRLK